MGDKKKWREKGNKDGGSRRGEGERGQGCGGVIVQWGNHVRVTLEKSSSWENEQEVEQLGRQIPFIRTAQVSLKQQHFLSCNTECSCILHRGDNDFLSLSIFLCVCFIMQVLEVTSAIEGPVFIHSSPTRWLHIVYMSIRHTLVKV